MRPDLSRLSPGTDRHSAIWCQISGQRLLGPREKEAGLRLNLAAAAPLLTVSRRLTCRPATPPRHPTPDV